MSTTVERGLELRLQRVIRATRQRVFAAWITPADLLKWFGSKECQPRSARIHPRVGGEYHFRLKTERHGEVHLHGVFRELKRPSRLVYTWNLSGDPKLEHDESLVTVEFLGHDGATEIRITHDHLPNEEIREDHTRGWNECLDSLEKHLGVGTEAPQKSPTVGEFCWNELLTNDESGAERFYSAVFGWQTADFPGAGVKYTLWKQRGKGVGGLMKQPSEGIPPHWLAYVTVADVEATARKVGEAGGELLMEPFDVPTVGRIAVFQDPQGAVLGIFQPLDKPASCGSNQVVWCDIPVKDLDRAMRFYSAVLGAPVKKEQCEGKTFGLLPHAGENAVSGCLSPAGEGNEPSPRGTLVYLSCEGRLEQAVAAAESNGGKVLQPKHPIGQYGSRAIVLDSEGNRIALHSM